MVPQNTRAILSSLLLKPILNRKPVNVSLANSEDPNEMPDVAFHRGLNDCFFLYENDLGTIWNMINYTTMVPRILYYTDSILQIEDPR